MKVLFGVGILLMVLLIIGAVLDDEYRDIYIKKNINVGQEFIFEDSEYAKKIEQNTESAEYKIGIGPFGLKGIYFIVKNDTIVSVRSDYGLL